MRRFFKKIEGRLSNRPLLAIALISLTAVITYASAFHGLGYYYDDWYTLWSGVSRGADSLIPLFSRDRPFMGVIYSIFFHLVDANILGWHWLALLFRIASGLAFYWILQQVFPKLKELAVLTAMLFVVFPGFLAEPNAATKVNQLMGYSAALFSIALSLKTFKEERRGWKYVFIGLSLLTLAYYLWIYEYMIGLEVMRLALLYYLSSQGKSEKVLKIAIRLIKRYIPYLLVIGIFLIWRVFIFQNYRSATDLGGLVRSYQSDFLGMGLRLVFQVVKDFFSATVFAWFVQPYRLLAVSNYKEIIVALLLALLVASTAIVFHHVMRKSETGDSKDESPWILIVLGSLIALGAVFPVVLSDRYLNLNDAYKAYALHPSAGAIIILLGLFLMVKLPYRKVGLIALLGFSVMTQSLNGQAWGGYWESQKNFWWQLSWRAPDIEDETLVMSYLPSSFPFHEDYEIWGPLNLIYRQLPLSSPAIQAQILNQETVALVIDGTMQERSVRDIYLPRFYSNLLLLGQPNESSCMHVIDGTLPIYSANERPLVEQVAAFSNINFIDPYAASPTPPEEIFGQEPEHDWCYYYQKASLARQTGDWASIAALYKTSIAAGFTPNDASEYFVFIEGLVNTNNIQEAETIANDQIKTNAALKYSLCKSLAAAPDYAGKEQIQEIICQ